MKVNQIVGEHAKGMRAKKYAKKPVGTIAPKKPEAPKATEKQGVSEDGQRYKFQRIKFRGTNHDIGEERYVFSIDGNPLVFNFSSDEDNPDPSVPGFEEILAKVQRDGAVEHFRVTPAEQQLMAKKIAAERQRYLDQRKHEADMEEEFTTMTNSSGKIIDNDGKTITVAMPDGTQIQKPITPDTMATDPQGKPIINLATQTTQGTGQPAQNPQDMFAKGKDVAVNTGTPVKEDELSNMLRVAGIK